MAMKISVLGTYSETYELIEEQYGRYLIMVVCHFDDYNRNLISFFCVFPFLPSWEWAIKIYPWLVGNAIAEENVHDGKK